ncbi:MAG: hypothetical protein COC01_01460 [Bacteroidetes bacterium]|nr:MAG: hypothetical protein COC01_01460 [Bacteroidota bacterium]
MSEKLYKTMKEFYPYYLEEHRKRGTRITHFVGTTLFFVFLVLAFVKTAWFFIPTVMVPYAFAWVGHFFIEKNKPATFQYPLFSLASDFKLYFHIIAGKQGWGE